MFVVQLLVHSGARCKSSMDVTVEVELASSIQYLVQNESGELLAHGVDPGVHMRFQGRSLPIHLFLYGTEFLFLFGFALSVSLVRGISGPSNFSWDHADAVRSSRVFQIL